MIFFGHIGITTAIIKSIEEKTRNNKISIDYRFVILGSILPDLIDKPIGLVLTKSLLKGERFIAHTLIFSLIIIISGIFNLYKNRNLNWFVLGICCFIHTILDLMWVFPKKYFYPIYGLKFPVVVNSYKLPHYARMYFSNYSYVFFELLGFVLLCTFFNKNIKREGIRSFIQNGVL